VLLTDPALEFRDRVGVVFFYPYLPIIFDLGESLWPMGYECAVEVGDIGTPKQQFEHILG